jgi:hypothetical protein
MIRILFTIIAAMLAVAWGLVFWGPDQTSVLCWWFVMFFSLAGVIFTLFSLVLVAIRVIRKKLPETSLFLLLIVSMIAAWPAGWFMGYGRIAYPSDAEKTQPSVSIRLPVDQSVIVAWGGNPVEQNFHATFPFERWAYDLLAQPAALKTPNLEEYGIFGQTVLAPIDGTVIGIRNDVPDLPAGTELNNSDIRSMLGNYIFLRIDETNTYLVMAHLMADSVTVKQGQHVSEGMPIARVGNSGNTSEPHIHIHHQRQDPSTTNFFLAKGLPLFFREIDGPPMPTGGVGIVDGREVPIGMTISPLKKK